MLRALLGRLTDDDLADSIVGDLEEQRRRRGGSGVAGYAWFVLAMVEIVGNISLQKLRETLRRLPNVGRHLTPRREIRQAMRSLTSSPWYAAAVVSVISLSLALAATVFAIVYSSASKCPACCSALRSAGSWPPGRFGMSVPASTKRPFTIRSSGLRRC
jgi:hypothetical protein